MSERYDEFGAGYGQVRREDPAIRDSIHAALGDAISVVNVGAGVGSYEPSDREVTAIEPSAGMIAQRPPGSARVIQGRAEQLPFGDGSFDAAMAVLTVHHWSDVSKGLDEMIRVAGRRVIVVAFDTAKLEQLWIAADYFPAIQDLKHGPGTDSREIVAMIPGAAATVIPVSRDCSDLFFAALWSHPEMFFVDEVVNPMWVWQSMSEIAREAGRQRLAADLDSGEWDRKYGHLRELVELDVGLRLITLELPA